MDCPYTKPAYLNEHDAKNCYATNRGWVILKPHGKYDVIESIMGLDDKIKAWEKENGVDTPVNDIPEEFNRSVKKLNKTILEEELEHVHVRLANLNEEIAKVEETLPVLDKVAVEKIVPAKKAAKVKKEEQKEETKEEIVKSEVTQLDDSS